MVVPSGCAETATVEWSPPPPPPLAHSHVPSAPTLAVNTSLSPTEVRSVLPKEAVPRKNPTTMDEPSGSAETPYPSSSSKDPACVAHAHVPSAPSFATTTSLPPALSKEMPSPKLTVALIRPVTMEDPSGKAEMLKPASSAYPPAVRTCVHAPLAFNVPTNMSRSPLLVTLGWLPKVAVPWNSPVTTDEPSASAATERPSAGELSTTFVAQTHAPPALTFATNAPSAPPFVMLRLPPKLAVPRYTPVTIADPSCSAEIPLPQSPSAPPACVAHAQVPSALTLATNTSSVPAPARLMVPKAALPPICPVMIDEPSGNVETPLAQSPPLPPACVAQAHVPFALRFATNTS